MTSTARTLAVGVAVIAAGVLVAYLRVNPYLYFAGYVILQYVVIASAWNILGGYAGYVNFGTGAFFAIGAYTAVVLFKALGAPIVLQMAAGAAVSGLLGFSVGLLTLRLRGIFFAIATVAITFILETLMVNWRYVGGATGLQLLRPNVELYASYTRMLFAVMVVMSVGSVVLARYIQTSWLGRGLRALRDSEEAAEANGVPTLKLKLLACVISGALLAAGGAPMPMYLSFIEPASTFNLSYTVSSLGGSIIGGMSHWGGPIIGAMILSTLQQVITVTISGEVNVLIVGVLLVLFVVLAPEGVMGLFKRWLKPSSR